MAAPMRRLLVLAALPLLAACLQPWSSIGGEEPVYNVLDPAAPTVAVLGDSLTVQARILVHEALEPAHSAKLAAWFGEGLAGGPLTAGLGSPEPVMVTAARRMAVDPPDVLVVALGTNDAWQTGLTPEATAAGLATILGLFPDACVVSLTVNDWTTLASYDTAEAAAFNAGLAANPDIDVLVDWATIGEEPGVTGSDSIHLSPLGYTRYAAEIAAGVEACGVEPPPTTTTTIGE